MGRSLIFNENNFILTTTVLEYGEIRWKWKWTLTCWLTSSQRLPGNSWQRVRNSVRARGLISATSWATLIKTSVHYEITLRVIIKLTFRDGARTLLITVINRSATQRDILKLSAANVFRPGFTPISLHDCCNFHGRLTLLPTILQRLAKVFTPQEYFFTDITYYANEVTDFSTR